MPEKTDTQQTAQEQFDAGHGGSYSLDPATGERTLLARTEPATVSRKKPTTDEAGKEVEPSTAPDASDTPAY